MHCDVTDVGLAVRRILDCIVAINHWMSSNRLKLNLDKTQFLRLGTWQQLKKFDLLPIHMPSGWIIHPSSIAKDLSVTLYSYLTMVAHVDKMVKVCMYQLRQLSLYLLRKSQYFDAASVLVHAFIVSRTRVCKLNGHIIAHCVCLFI